jgi:hypothetical protein
MDSKIEIITKSILTCPNCGKQKEEEIPTNACQYFYTCMHCNFFMKPKLGDCCVFCSYGTKLCPPKQMEKKCC